MPAVDHIGQPNNKGPWRWPVRRLMLAGQLYERGWTFDEIARHDEIRSDARSVRRALRRAGAAVDDCRKGRAFRALVRFEHVPGMEALAQARRIDLDELFGRAVGILAADPALLNNVLDDGV